MLEIEVEEEQQTLAAKKLRKIIEEGTGKVFIFKYWTSSQMEETFSQIVARYDLQVPKVFAPPGARGGGGGKEGNISW